MLFIYEKINQSSQGLYSLFSAPQKLSLWME